MTTLFVEVAVVLPVMDSYYYRVPPELNSRIAVGQQVVVPFSRRRLIGYILSVQAEPPLGPETTIRDILQINSELHYFTEGILPFYRWLSNYYLAPLGEIIRSAMPSGASTDTRRVAFISEAGRRVLFHKTATPDHLQVLSLLGEHPGLSLGQIRQHLPQLVADQICRSLSSKHLIVWEDQVQEPRVKPRQLTVVRLVSEPYASTTETDELKQKEREILALLGKGPHLLRDLQHHNANAHYWVKRLVNRGLVVTKREEVQRNPIGPAIIEPGSVPELTVDQQTAVDTVSRALQKDTFASFLLYGVTGSGKTEVYLSAAAEAARLKRQSLILVPEIALTAQMEAVFRQRFSSGVAILHSGLGLGERRDEWMRVHRGEVDVVVGARSALFAPLERLGLVVVDEEHDSSYKQEGGLRYHGRDAAVMRAKLARAVALLGSATPALSSYYNALRGKFHLLCLPQRIDHRPLPKFAVVDMRKQKKNVLLSLPLRQALADTLSRGKQALLLINRRGYANFLLCRQCGHVPPCRNCALSLTWHRASEELRCHICGLAAKVSLRCPQCSSSSLTPFGFGTQRVEAEVGRLFPEAQVSRMDLDTTQRKHSSRQLLRDFSLGRTDILVGTQMIAKGHDFPNITLVGVISADIALQWPDFRAAENTFQILTQVAGRSGRGDSPGNVIVQTYNPEHYSIRFARDHNYTGFIKEEMIFRKELGYPPYRRLLLFRLGGNVAEKTEQAATRLAVKSQELLTRQDLFQELEILGPVAAPLPRLKGKYRWQILMRSRKSAPLVEAGRQLMVWGNTALKGTGVNLSVDVDPMSLM